MRQAGIVVAKAHAMARELCVPGAKTIEIDAAVEEVFRRHDGIPGPRVIREGDIVSIDTGCKVDGWCGDAAVTIIVGEVPPEVQQLVQVTREVLHLAIREMGRQQRWSQVAASMQRYVRTRGLSVVEKYVGHGIGREMHEDPQVPNFVSPQLLRHDFPLSPGLVLAIEPMVNLGTKHTRALRDHWTVVTRDGKWSAHFEHTVALTEDGPCVLTAPEGQEWPAWANGDYCAAGADRSLG
jgi:methionyl aminopeptidase